VEAAADLPAPADVDRALARVELDPGLLALDAVRLRDGIDVEILEPGTQRVLDLRQAYAPAEKDIAVNVDFQAHRCLPFPKCGKNSTGRRRGVTGGAHPL
jgi:hypothetical protein